MLQIDQEIQTKNDGNRKKTKVALFYSSIPSLNAARSSIIMYKLFIAFILLHIVIFYPNILCGQK